MRNKKKLLMLLLVSLLYVVPTVYATTQKFEWFVEPDNDHYWIFGSHYASMTFTPRDTFNITIVSIKCYRHGSPTTLHVQVCKTYLDKPTSSILSTGTFDPSTITADVIQWINISVSQYELETSVTYCITFYVTGTSDSSNFVAWRGVTTGGTYERGSFCWSFDSGSSWSINLNGDDNFIVYGTITLPYVPPPLTLNIQNLPAIMQTTFSLPSVFVAQIFLSTIVMFSLLLPVMVLSKKTSPITYATITILGLGGLVSIGWLDTWVMILVVLIVVALFASKIADVITG